MSLNSEISTFISNPNVESTTLQSHAQFVSALLAAFACDPGKASESATAMERTTAAKKAVKCGEKVNDILLLHTV